MDEPTDHQPIDSSPGEQDKLLEDQPLTEPHQTSAISNGAGNTTNNDTTTLATTTRRSNLTEDLFSTKKWGVTPIRQDTPWELPPSPSQTQQQQPQQSQQQQQQLSLHQQPIQQQQQQQQQLHATLTSSSSTSSVIAPSEFARAPGPASSSILNNNVDALANHSSAQTKPFGAPVVGSGMGPNRSSTWSAFGPPSSNEPEDWPKSNLVGSGISAAPGSGVVGAHSNSVQPSNAFDLVPNAFKSPGESWPGSMMGIKTIDPYESALQTAAAASAAATVNMVGGGMSPFGAVNSGAYHTTTSSKSPTGSQYEPSGIGTWSPVVKGGRPGSRWDGDGPDNGRGDNGRFDDGTAIWGSPVQNKVAGVEWIDKSGGDANSNNDKSRGQMTSAAPGNNQSYRPQQSASSSSSTSLHMSSNTSPSNQHNRNQQQTLKQPSISHNSFDQVHQQSNALSSQANQPNRGLGLSSNVPSTQQLKHMVQQIQLAVQAGHLNPQILNQPLAPVTLQLLYQLLQQIKILHTLQMQASSPQQFNKPGNQPGAVNVHITKTKQTILNLQNQIAAQQAVYLKQNQAPHNISSRQPTKPNLAGTGGVSIGGPALPPGISQSGDSFHGQGMVNNFGVDSMSANGLANSLGHMNLGGSSVLHSSRFDQPWRAPAAAKQQAPSSSPFANHNLMTQSQGSMQKSMLGNNVGGSGSPFALGAGLSQAGNEFARAPGQTSSMMDNNLASSKPFGMTNRSSTWSAFGSPAPNESEPEWPKTTTSGISTQPSNAFDLVPEFEPGKPWRGSMLMKSVEDDPTMTPGSMARSLAPRGGTIWSDQIQ